MSLTKKKARTGSFDGRLSKLRKDIKRSPIPLNDVALFKNKCTIQELVHYSRIILEIPDLSPFFFGELFPKTISKLKAPHYFLRLKIDRELAWYACEFRLFSKQLQLFSEIEASFSQALLLGNYDIAHKILSTSRDVFGYSLWGLENQIALLELTEGIESQKSLTQSIVKNETVSDSLKLFTYFYSVRTERNISPEKYQSIFSKRFPTAASAENPLGQYMAFKLHFFGDVQFLSIPEILALDRNSSLIDRYLTFGRVCQLVISDPSQNSLLPHVRRVLSILPSSFFMGRFSALEMHADGHHFSSTDTFPTLLLTLLDQYTIGDYEESARGAVAAIPANPTAIDLYELHVKSNIRIGKTATPIADSFPLWQRLLSRMTDVLTKNERSYDAYQEILKLVYTFPLHPWSAQLFGFLMREYKHDASRIPLHYSSYCDLHASTYNPKQGRIFKDAARRRQYFDEMRKRYPNSPTVALFRITSCDQCDLDITLSDLALPTLRNLKYSAYLAERNGDLELAKVLYRDLAKSDDVLAFQDGTEGLARTHLNSGAMGDASDLIVNTFLSNVNFRAKLPVIEVLNAIERAYETSAPVSLSTAILYDIYSKYVSSNKDIQKALAYEHFLWSNECLKPSDLRPIITRFDLKQAVYFLRHICVFNVLDSSIEFESSEAVETERILICQLMTELDPSSSEFYSEEIKTITQRLLINRGLRAIEQSKIYVDVPGIRESVDQELRETYLRFKTLSEKTPNNEVTEELILRLQTFTLKNQSIQFVLPGSETYDVFKEFFFTLRDRFVSSNEHGLDAYLSVGIRHGTLAGQLRSPLERANLVTQKDKKGIYKNNEHWGRYLESRDSYESTIAHVQKKLAAFAHDVDQLIDVLRNQWLQIKTEERNPSGLFDFSITFSSLRDLQKRVALLASYEEAVDLVIEDLWRMTDKSLSHIRSRISTQYKRDFTSLFERLQLELHEVDFDSSIATLDDAVAISRTAIQDEVDKISSWFTRSGHAALPDFDIELPVDIALKMINNIHPTRPMHLDSRVIGEQKLAGSSLKNLVDVVFILFDNIAKHCQIGDRAPMVSIDCSCHDKRLSLIVKNELGPDYDQKAEKRKLSKLKDEIGNEKFKDKVRLEGGTGLHKVAKILAIDLGCTYTMDFLFDREKRFVFELAIKGGKIFS